MLTCVQMQNSSFPLPLQHLFSSIDPTLKYGKFAGPKEFLDDRVRYLKKEGKSLDAKSLHSITDILCDVIKYTEHKWRRGILGITHSKFSLHHSASSYLF